MTTINEVALTESRSLRAQYADRTSVLDKVKALAMLPDGTHVTTEMVASYYEVPLTTIESVVEDNREELETNGRHVLKGAELREFAAPFGGAANLGLHHNTRSLAVFSRRAVLNVGQLLRDSEIARQVRTYQLDIEENTATEDRLTAIIGRAQGQAAVLKTLQGVVHPEWLEAHGRILAARTLGIEPDLDPATRPLTVDEYLEERGVAAAARARIRSRFGMRLAAAYRVCCGREPMKVDRNIGGRITPVNGYTEADRDLFDQVWVAFEDGTR